MTASTHDKGYGSLQTAGALLSFTLIVAILYFAQTVLIPIALAMMLTFVLTPLVGLLQRMHFRRVPAVLSTVLLAGLLIASLITLMSIELNALANDLPQYESNIRSKIALLRKLSAGSALNKLRSRMEVLVQGDHAESAGKERPVDTASEPAQDSGAVPTLLAPLKALSPAFEILGRFSLAMILTVFMLIKREDLRNRLVSFIGRHSITTTTKALDDAGQRISRYMIMQLIINGIFGLAIGVGLFLIGIHYALLWGFCAMVLRYIPYIGAWIAAFAPLTVSFITSSSWMGMTLVFSLFLVLEAITANVIEPRLYGQGTGVSEIAVLVCAAFWAWLWGPVGLMLATPLTVCAVVAGKYVPSLSFFDKLLGDRPPLRSNAVLLQRLLARDLTEASEVVRDFCGRYPNERAYDNLFVPALALAMRDRANGAMPAEDEEYVVRETSALVRSICQPETRAARETSHDPGRIIGFPAHHQIDELTLVMLDQLVQPLGLNVDVCSTRSLPSERIARVVEQSPAIVFVAALAPGGLPQASFLCETLRERMPHLQILVGYWGCEHGLDEVIASLREAGADYVTTTLLGARRHILSSLGMPAMAPLPDAPVSAKIRQTA